MKRTKEPIANSLPMAASDMVSWNRADTDWFHAAQWGTFTHWLADAASNRDEVQLSAEDWNRRVEQFDVETFARQIAETGAKYHFFTLGQNSGFFCAPNAIYDDLVGETSRLSRRDLLGDIAVALGKRGVRAMAYCPSHAPALDRHALEGLHCTPRWDASKWGLKIGSYLAEPDVDECLSAFQRNWEAVIREWSLRWGTSVHGWWFDGCYYADRMYRHAGDPNFRSFAEAAKAGNPQSLVAFNPGILMPVICHSEFEDYTAGEQTHLATASKHAPLQRFIQGAQFHLLSHLGAYWGDGAPRYPDALVTSYTRYINSLDGVVTWDIPISRQGAIPDAFRRQLASLKRR